MQITKTNISNDNSRTTFQIPRDSVRDKGRLTSSACSRQLCAVPKHRKVLREMSRARLVKRAVKQARRVPSALTKSLANHFSNHHYSFEASLRGNITTGPECTPLGVMTLEQAEAYKRQRLADVQGAVQEGIDDSDAGRFTSLDSAEALKEHLKSLTRIVMESDE